ncbi:MAG: porin [Deltaproteobacteria bacterium]|nr:porin [Deltaproteobacteria bacterium]
MELVRRIVAAIAFAVLFAAGTAGARTIEEILKEKGVITEADYKEATRSKPVDYKLGKGFTFTSPDEKFQLSVGGRIQPRYSYTDAEAVSGSAQDASEWKIRWAKLSVGGYAYSKDLTYKIQIALENSGNAKLLDYAYLKYGFSDAFALQAGQFKVPFSRQALNSASALQFVDRSNAVDAFKPNYDIGAMASGKIGRGMFAYNAGIFGGAGQSATRTTNNNAFAARLVASPLGEAPYSETDVGHHEKPLLSVGANYFRNTLKRSATTVFESVTPNYAAAAGWLGNGASTFDNTEKVDIDQFGGDAAFLWNGFSFQAEYLEGRAEGKTSGKTLRARGMYAQAGYFLIPKRLEAAARYSYVDPNRSRSNDIQAETQGAVSYYFFGHNLKLQADYSNIHKQVSLNTSTDNKQVRVQAQVVF